MNSRNKPKRTAASGSPATLAALMAEALPGGSLCLTLFGPHDPGALFAALIPAPLAIRAFADAGPSLMRGAQPDCSACGQALDFPATIAILHADRPDAHHAMALACCTACTAEGPASLRGKLVDFLSMIFPGMRTVEPTHAAPETRQ